MKKIIFTVTNDLTYDQRMQKICRSLSKAGYQVELVGRERSASLQLTPEPYQQTRLKCLFNKGKLFYLEYNLRLLCYLIFSRFLAACAVDLDTIVPVYVAGKLKGAKLAYDAHEYFTEVPEVVNRPLTKKIWEWVERTFVPKYDLLYTVSGGLAELFKEKYQRDFFVIMNVPLLDIGHKTQDTRHKNQEPRTKNQDAGGIEGRGVEALNGKGAEPLILYQGALNVGRGLEHLVEVMPELNCQLKLAGEGDLSEQLRAQVRQLKLEDKVEFLGYVKPETLKQLTAEATLGINLLENKGLSYYYSLANKFFDYIHAGVPQVCIDFPEYKRLNGQYQVALLVKDCSKAEIKTALERLLNDKKMYAQLQKNCEVCSRDWNWQLEKKKLVSLYGQLLG